MICELSFSKFLDGYVLLNIGCKEYFKTRFQISFWKRAKNETNYRSYNHLFNIGVPKAHKSGFKNVCMLLL